MFVVENPFTEGKRRFSYHFKTASQLFERDLLTAPTQYILRFSMVNQEDDEVWGDRLFERSIHFMGVYELDALIGLPALEKTARDSRAAEAPVDRPTKRVRRDNENQVRDSVTSTISNTNSRRGPEISRYKHYTRPTRPDDGLVYTVYGPQCSDLAAIRQHVEALGIDNIMDLLENRPLGYAAARKCATFSIRDEEPLRLIFGICAMTLGCDLTNSMLKSLEEVYTDCLDEESWGRAQYFMSEKAVRQLGRVLHGPNPYRNGQPYSFGESADMASRVVKKLARKGVLIAEDEIPPAIKLEDGDGYQKVCGYCGSASEEESGRPLLVTEAVALGESDIQLICDRHACVVGASRTKKLVKSVIDCYEAAMGNDGDKDWQSESEDGHPNPLVNEILGPLHFAPTAQQLIRADPNIPRKKLERLKRIIEEDSDARTDMSALAKKLFSLFGKSKEGVLVKAVVVSREKS